ncbi:PLP-dependent aminotransferase family protein [Listeria ilorinensis]|uniref:aminotransferase-like domain-containing protein n=1 Tax=Listeria ilorinensis TaxID=2867439 RepID=UPI001EF4D2EC|nr:PLP-dependent aminotransferase family protein [Listeria ilorinensis]
MWTMEKTKDLPLYQQIMKLIEEKIEKGLLLPGEKLPPERKLAEMLEVNRSTVVRAFEELAALGIVIRKRGSGTVVNEEKWGQLTSPTTNWRHYVTKAAFQQEIPYIRSIGELGKRYPDEVIDLATGELPVDLAPTITMPPFSWQSFLEEEEREDAHGFEPLRQMIAEQMRQHLNIEASGAEVLITSGAQQALFLITQCLLEPGDAIAIESPSYFYSLSLFQSAGLRIFALPMDESGIDLTELERLYRKHRIKMVFVNPTFQNPTGQVMAEQKRRDFLSLCAHLQIPIVEDDPFGQLTYDLPNQPPALKKLGGENVLYIGSLSKVMGSTTRIGWLVGPPAVTKRLALARQEMDFGLSIFPQVLAHHVLTAPDFEAHLKTLRQTLEQKRDLLADALDRYVGNKIDFKLPQGGFHLWIKLPPSLDLKEFNRFLDQKLLVMPGFLFGARTAHLRLSYARIDQKSAEKAARILAEILSADDSK